MTTERHDHQNVNRSCSRGPWIWYLVVLAVILLIAFTGTVFKRQQPCPQTEKDEHAWSSQFQNLKRTQKRVLVTGAAGFIGFHVAKKLASENSAYVVGLDNFNDYYDVQLKIDRAYELHQTGVHIHHADLCDTEFLRRLLRISNFTHVVHMGAQAGVRYSLVNPLAYVHSNLEGYQAVLDVLTEYPHVHFIYASSSSVYGKESGVPFSLSANADKPGNMYAATKRANELMAFQHCTATGVKSVGLRLFTVYGPWGRPDMAVYKFAESILDGKKVPMFHISDNKTLGRDFTYVEDIIDGVLRLLDYRVSVCGAVFNLGYGHPVSVPRLVSILEEELGMSAEIDKLPLPPSEILQTWADIGTSREQFGFCPKTDLRTGVRNFVHWFKEYRQKRRAEEASGEVTPQNIWYSGLLAEVAKRHNSVPFEMT